jgi:hypothetical protein
MDIVEILLIVALNTIKQPNQTRKSPAFENGDVVKMNTFVHTCIPNRHDMSFPLCSTK